jgi:hypothetical protein
MPRDNIWPDGKRFAFTVCDDTDSGTVENVGRVYALLEDLGLRTTRACWPLRGDPNIGEYPGQTLDDPDYRRWLLDLQSKGFEIGWHGATWHGSPSDRTAAGLERFAEVFQHYPLVASNHTRAREAMYWGSYRVSGWRRLAYNILTLYQNHNISGGNIEGDEYFWGDLCRRRIKYYRNFAFQDINTLKECPFMPYRDPARPYVNYWFASSNGNTVESFNRCLAEENQDRLEAEGGACIMYTHFAINFLERRGLNARFEHLMRRLAKKNGWFVPVSTLLDRIQAVNGDNQITDSQRRWLERKWLWEKIFVGKT